MGSYQRPHNNEVILSWLRTIDPAYADFEKETAAQRAGYRRLYMGDMGRVSGTVEDENGNVVARFRDGKLTMRTDKWIGITTSDSGGWLRLPLENSYTVRLNANDGGTIPLKLAEYRIYDNTEVRTVISDTAESPSWDTLVAGEKQSVVLTVPAVESSDGTYALPDTGTDAAYTAGIEAMSVRVASMALTFAPDGTAQLTVTLDPPVDLSASDIWTKTNLTATNSWQHPPAATLEQSPDTYLLTLPSAPFPLFITFGTPGF